MVVYTCSRCGKQFLQKCKYDNHLNRKIKCFVTNKTISHINNNIYCEICDKYFSRPDVLKKHNSSKSHLLLQNKNIKNGNNSQQIIGDNNKIINKNYYFLLPFGKEEIDALTTEDKIAIFTSRENPLIMIIIKTNLNPITTQYHNVGYTDNHLGYGLIYDGETWQQKEIKEIMNDLLHSKREDLLKIYEEIKEYLSDVENNNIKTKMDDVNVMVYPISVNQFNNRKMFISKLKKRFCTNKHLLLEAVNRSNKPITEIIKNKSIFDYKNILRDGLTIEKLDEILKTNKKNKEMIHLKKKLNFYLLHKIKYKIDMEQYESLTLMINNIHDSNVLDIIITLLINSYYFDKEISINLINIRLEQEKQIENLLSNLMK